MVCPGESACDRFQSAAGKTQKAKERNACSNCELLPTKRFGKQNDGFLQRITNEAMDIRYERIAGYPRSLERMTPVHFVAVRLIEELFEQEERRLRIHSKAALFAIAGIKDQ